MSVFNVITLLGGLAMFLYGMRLMGDSLKEGSSGTLKKAMEKLTGSPVRAFLLGLAVTALIQSSTATIVITSGLVAAGILSLHQSLGVIIGANVGTTVTGQIIRLLDIDSSAAAWLQVFRPSTLAPVALVIGIILVMFVNYKNSKNIGNIAIGFGILFSGLLNMTGAVDALADSGAFNTLLGGLGDNPLIGYLTGVGVAFILQSSSATIGILQAFSMSGLLAFKAIYAVIVGIYLGDCVTTAIVCSIGAKAEARRVGIVNILFNLSETVFVLVAVTAAHKLGLLTGLWERTVNSGTIANTNTIFNMGCAVLLFPMLPVYEKLANRIVKNAPEAAGPYDEKLLALSPSFFSTPAIALNSCYDALHSMFSAAVGNLEAAYRQLGAFDEKRAVEIARLGSVGVHDDQKQRVFLREVLAELVEHHRAGVVAAHVHDHAAVRVLQRRADVRAQRGKLGGDLVDVGAAVHLHARGLKRLPALAGAEVGVGDVQVHKAQALIGPEAPLRQAHRQAHAKLRLAAAVVAGDDRHAPIRLPQPAELTHFAAPPLYFDK